MIPMATDSDHEQSPRQRGPGYPTLDLASAIDRAQQLATMSPKHAIQLTNAAEVWGYSPRSSNTLKTAAALKRFGLVDDVGDGNARQLRLTAFARELLFYADDRSSEKWTQLVQDAALRPTIHREILSHFEDTLPDDRVVVAHLIFERHFNEASAKDFIKKFRQTLEFAGLDGMAGPYPPPDRSQPPGSRAASPSVLGAPAFPRAGTGEPQPASDLRRVDARPYGGSIPGPLPGHRAVSIPYSPGQWATLEASFPLTEREWNSLTAMLEAMKPGLVDEGTSPSDEPRGDVPHPDSD